MIVTNLTQLPRDAILRGVPDEYRWVLADNREGRERWLLNYPGFEEGLLPALVILSEPFITHPGGMRVYLVLRYDPGIEIPHNLLEHRNFERAQERAIAEAGRVISALKRAKVKKITAKRGKSGASGTKHPGNRVGRASKAPGGAMGRVGASAGS